MKVLVYSTDFPPSVGGVAVFVHNICLQLHRQGHRVDVLTQKKSNNHQSFPYRVFCYSPFKRLASLVPILKTIILHSRNRYDLIFMGHFITTSALGLWILNKIGNIPYVILSHGNDLWNYTIYNKIDKIVARMLLKSASLLLANSRSTAERIKKGGYKESPEVLAPGVDINHFNPNVDYSGIIRKYRLQGRKVLLTVARLATIKNIDSVLRALCQVVKSIPNVYYLIAGDGEEYERLKKLRDKLGLCYYVCFLGNVNYSQLPYFYNASDLFVLPSFETFGISFIEANACCKPVIAGRSGGAMEAVAEGETGLLVDPNNVDEIAMAIIQLLTDQKLARQMGINGRRRVEEKLNLDKMGNRLENYLCRIVS